LLQVVTRAELDDELRRGRLARPFPRAYLRPWYLDDPATMNRAALVSVGPPAILSHDTALRAWGLLPAGGTDIHVTVPKNRRLGDASAGLAIHHAGLPFPGVRGLHGLPTATAAAAAVMSWPTLPTADRRATVINGTRSRLMTTLELRGELGRATRLSGRSELLELADLLDQGCESELEIWGYLDVFNVPELRDAKRQHRVRVGGRSYRLDLAYEAEQVAVELDGRAFHSSPGQWERDTARDLALATIGWQTVRLSHHRLTKDVAGCRRDVIAVLGSRRQMRARRR